MTLTRGLCLLFIRTNSPALRPSIAHRCRVHPFSGARAHRAVEGKDHNTRSFASRKNRQQETALDLLNSPLNVGGFLFKLACACLVLYVLNVLQTTVFLRSLFCSCVCKECSWHTLGINGFDCGPRLKVFPASPRLQGPFWAE